jgi:hypothetical protein
MHDLKMTFYFLPVPKEKDNLPTKKASIKTQKEIKEVYKQFLRKPYKLPHLAIFL